MTAKVILIAASPGVAAENWLGRKIRESIPDFSEVKVFLLDGNPRLKSVIAATGADCVVLPAAYPLRRSKVRQILEKCDYMLLFWDGRTLTELLFEGRLRNVPMKVFSIEVTDVVNKERTDDYDAYIGRGTPWGNPYHVGKQQGQFERDEAISLYRKHFKDNILGDDAKRRGLFGLRGMRLACHCKPLACHGDVIAEYLNAQDPDELEK